MDTASLDIDAIAQQLNEAAQGRRFGELQALRTKLKGFSRKPGTKIFSSQTIHDGWAFHHGGRSELQFNIGTEDSFGAGTELRYGVAFSFELSQTLKSIDVLLPKVRLFNDYMRERADEFADMRMWHHTEDGPSNLYPAGPVLPELVREGVFVFLGLRQSPGLIDYDAILDTFERLLPLYEYVESGGKELPPAPVPGGFKPGFSEKADQSTRTLAERQLNVTLRHNQLQTSLCRRLAKLYGDDNVAAEHQTVHGMIDVAVRRSAEEFWYYEIKTAYSARACLREAFGQIMEYAYWPGSREPKKLIICGESPLDVDGTAYLDTLRKRFSLPIEYEKIEID